MQCELNEVESPEGGGEQASAVSTPGTSSSPQTSLPQSHPSTSSNNSSDGLRDNVPCLKYSLFSSISDLLASKIKTTWVILHIDDMAFSCVSLQIGRVEQTYCSNVCLFDHVIWFVLFYQHVVNSVLCLTWPGSGVLLSNSLRVTRWSCSFSWCGSAGSRHNRSPAWPSTLHMACKSMKQQHKLIYRTYDVFTEQLKTLSLNNSCSLSFRQVLCHDSSY